MLQQVQPLFRGFVAFLLEGLAFDLELDQAAVEPVHFLRLGINFHADARGRLVHQINRLVRQIAVGDVAVRQHGGGDDGRVGDFHPVMHFIAFVQAAQNGDGVLDARFVHQHFLETPLQRRVLLDVFAVFVQGGRADAVQFAARQRRLEHVAGVHRTLGLARANHGVQLVHEQDDLAFLLGQVLQHRLQSFLELAAKLGAGDQRAHVQRQHPLVLQSFRHLAVDDALGQTLDDGSLADASLAD